MVDLTILLESINISFVDNLTVASVLFYMGISAFLMVAIEFLHNFLVLVFLKIIYRWLNLIFYYCEIHHQDGSCLRSQRTHTNFRTCRELIWKMKEVYMCLYLLSFLSFWQFLLWLVKYLRIELWDLIFNFIIFWKVFKFFWMY